MSGHAPLPVGSSDDELADALSARLQAALRDVGPMLVPALVPVLVDVLRDGLSRTPDVSSARALLPVDEAARRLGIGRTTVFGLIRTGELRSVSVGRRRLVPADAIEAFVAKLG